MIRRTLVVALLGAVAALSMVRPLAANEQSPAADGLRDSSSSKLALQVGECVVSTAETVSISCSAPALTGASQANRGATLTMYSLR